MTERFAGSGAGQRRGFTLVEAAVAMAVSGLLLLIALPKVTTAVRSSQLRSARGAVATLYAQARNTAINRRQTATLRVAADSVWITARQGGADVRVGTAVHLRPNGIVAAATQNLVIAPTGLLQGGGGTITLTRDGQAVTLTISGAGRIQ